MLLRASFSLPFLLLLAFASSGRAGAEIAPAKGVADADGKVLWYDIRLLDVEGQGWKETKDPFDRLPAKAEGTVREPIWNLSRNSAGLCVRFITDATTIKARWTLKSDRLAMPHMPATGVSGLDLYVRHEGGWHWLAVGIPKENGKTQSAALGGSLPVGEREFLLYLPLYNGVSSVEIGLPKDSALAKGKAYDSAAKPIVFYGTSITQGASASRPGMVHTAILQRRLGGPVINLGFSGNGKMEPEMAKLFAELDPAVYVLDCLPNMLAAEVTERVEPFVATLRRAHPDTPILLVEDRSYPDAILVESKRQRNVQSRAALQAAYERLKKAGTPNVHYVAGDELLNEDGEGTVDSSHPTDLGFMHQAHALEEVLRPILAK